jgi:hypothetical protein
MPKFPRKRKNGGRASASRRRAPNLQRGPSGAIQEYRGPVRLPGRAMQEAMVLVSLTSTSAVSSSVAGLLANTFSMNPGGFTDWASYKVLYDEFRVLGTEMTYIPNYNNTYAAALIQAPFLIGTDRDSNTVPANYGAAWNYESAVVGTTGSKLHLTAKMTGSEDAQFLTTTSGVVPWYHWYFANGLTASTNYGSMFFRMLVQFRGRV